jgi:hypothetical protein
MDDFPIIPPIIVKDTPKPRRIMTIKEAATTSTRRCASGGRRLWREVWHRLKMVTGEDEAIEAIGDLRELLVEEVAAAGRRRTVACPRFCSCSRFVG